MSMNRRAALKTLAASALAARVPFALAQAAYPSRSVRLVVGAPPGGAPDIVARLVSQRMNLGQSVVVENRNGAAMAIAAENVAHSAPDGYSLLLTSQTGIAVSPIINNLKGFDPLKDFTGVAFVGNAPLVLVAGPALKANTVAEVIAQAKARPGSIDCGNGGIGTTPFMAAALFNQMTGTKFTNVPYPGEQASMTEIMAGRLPMMFANAAAAMPHVKAGRLRAIGVTSPNRVDIAKGVPTVAESGVPGYEIGTWLGIVAPTGTPPAVIEKINAEVRRVIAIPEVRETLTVQGFITGDETAEQFNAFIRSEHAKWGKVIRDGNIKPE